MNVLVSETQLKSLIEYNSKKEIDEQDDTSDPEPKSGASDNQYTGGDGYPDVSTWEDVVGSQITRGPANQIKNTKWSDVVGSEITRGPANQLNEQIGLTHQQKTDWGGGAYKFAKEFGPEELDNLQNLLDWAGLVPFAGDPIDLINALIYFGRAYNDREFNAHAINGMLSLIGIVPVVGSLLTVPFRKIFNALGEKSVRHISKLLGEQKKGKDAARYLHKKIKENPKLKNAVEEIKKIMEDYFGKDLEQFFDLFKSGGGGLSSCLKGTPKWIKRAPFFKRIFKFVENILKSIDEFIRHFFKLSSKKPSITKINPKDLTKSGRIAPKIGLGSIKIPIIKKTIPKINIKNRKKIFLALQDMFRSYLMKGELYNIPNYKLIIKQVLDNNNIKFKNIDDIPKFIQKNKKIQKEITSLVIYNHPKIFEKFLKTSTFASRFTAWTKTITDPSLYKDVTTIWGALRTMGIKLASVTGRKHSETKAQADRRFEKEKREKQKNKKTTPNKTATPQNKKTTPNKTAVSQNKKTKSNRKFKTAYSFPFKLGQKNSILKNLQYIYGLPQTGNYDKKLQQALKNNGIDTSNGLTWELYKKAGRDYYRKNSKVK